MASATYNGMHWSGKRSCSLRRAINARVITFEYSTGCRYAQTLFIGQGCGGEAWWEIPEHIEAMQAALARR